LNEAQVLLALWAPPIFNIEFTPGTFTPVDRRELVKPAHHQKGTPAKSRKPKTRFNGDIRTVHQAMRYARTVGFLRVPIANPNRFAHASRTIDGAAA
jgi:hypothetical protein